MLIWLDELIKMGLTELITLFHTKKITPTLIHCVENHFRFPIFCSSHPHKAVSTYSCFVSLINIYLSAAALEDDISIYRLFAFKFSPVVTYHYSAQRVENDAPNDVVHHHTRRTPLSFSCGADRGIRFFYSFVNKWMARSQRKICRCIVTHHGSSNGGFPRVNGIKSSLLSSSVNSSSCRCLPRW